MSAQLAPILEDLDRHRRCFDLTADGFGEALAETAAAAVFEYMDQETDPDNRAWAPLAEWYAERKAEHFPGRIKAELYLLMKTPDQLKGTLEIEADRMVQTYGTDEEARQEANWFQEGSDVQPPRRFYAFNDLALVTLGGACDRRFDEMTA